MTIFTPLRNAAPEIALVDIRLPDIDGVEVARRPAEQGAHTNFVLLLEPQLVHRVLQLGASGYVMKDGAAEEVLDAIRNRCLSSGLRAQAGTRLRRTSP